MVAVHGRWKLQVFGVQLFSVSNTVTPLVCAIGLALTLVLTSPALRHSLTSRSRLGFYSVAAMLTWLLSLGPAPMLMGKPFMYRGPYAALMLFPGFNALRVPARFWLMTTLCLAIAGAFLFDRVAARFGRWRLAGAVAVSLAALSDGWVANFPLAKAPPIWKVETCGTPNAAHQPDPAGAAILELPLGNPSRDAAAMYRGMTHGRPVVNGYSGYFPPHYAALRFGLGLHDDDVLTQLASFGMTDLVVDSANDADGVWKQYVTGHPGTQIVCSQEGRTLYRLRPSAAAGKLPAAERSSNVEPLLPIAALHANVNEGDEKFMVDGNRTTRWQSGPQSDRTVVDIDLGAERSVQKVQLLLGPFIEDFPRRLSIEALGPGAAWVPLYKGGSAGRAFIGAFESPREVPLTFDFPPVTTRYIRLRSLVNDETYYWSIAELKVMGR
jgi:hypothetical protein